MNQLALDNMKAIINIRKALKSGTLTYDEAKAKAQPVIDSINIKAAEIAKKHNKKPTVFNFTGLMR